MCSRFWLWFQIFMTSTETNVILTRKLPYTCSMYKYDECTLNGWNGCLCLNMCGVWIDLWGTLRYIIIGGFQLLLYSILLVSDFQRCYSSDGWCQSKNPSVGFALEIHWKSTGNSHFQELAALVPSIVPSKNKSLTNPIQSLCRGILKRYYMVLNLEENHARALTEQNWHSNFILVRFLI